MKLKFFKTLIFFINFLFFIFPSFSLALKFSEIFPNPEGKDFKKEWIEIYNETSSLDLYQWKIKDKAGKIFEIKKHLFLKKGEFLVIFPNPKLILNNQNETLYLIDPQGKIIDKVGFQEKIPEGFSWCLKDGFWKVCLPTKGKENKFFQKREEALLNQNFEEKNSLNKTSLYFFLFSSLISAFGAFFFAKKLYFLLPKK